MVQILNLDSAINKGKHTEPQSSNDFLANSEFNDNSSGMINLKAALPKIPKQKQHSSNVLSTETKNISLEENENEMKETKEVINIVTDPHQPKV
jgi:hypothetical protein